MSGESQWRPIETAPKEGAMLVYMPDEHRQFQVMYRNGRMAVIGGAFAFDLSKPTHWMPLPVPPQTEPRRIYAGMHGDEG